MISHMLHGAGIYANIKGVFVDGIHGTPYIAAPWIRHGYDITWLVLNCQILNRPVIIPSRGQTEGKPSGKR